MTANYPVDNDNPDSDESRLEDEQRLREIGLDKSELSDEEAADILSDLGDDSSGGETHDDGDELSDVVPPEEQDGND